MSDSPKTMTGKIEMLTDLAVIEEYQEPSVLMPLTLVMDIYAQLCNIRPDLCDKIKDAVKGNSHG